MGSSTKPIVFRSKSAMARGLGVNRNTVIAWSGKPDFPGGDSGPWDLSAIVPWIMGRNQGRPEEGDPLLSSEGESEGLERYRLAKAALAELDLEERKGNLQTTDQVKSILGRLALMLRRCGEVLSKRHGSDAAQVFNDTLREFEAAVIYELGAINTSDTRINE